MTQILSRIECISYSSTFHSCTWWIIRRWEYRLSCDCQEVVRLISSPSSRFIEYMWDWLADALFPVGVKYEFWPLPFVMPCPHPVLNEIKNGFRHGTVDTMMLQWRRMAVTIIASDWCRGASGRKSKRLRYVWRSIIRITTLDIAGQSLAIAVLLLEYLRLYDIRYQILTELLSQKQKLPPIFASTASELPKPVIYTVQR